MKITVRNRILLEILSSIIVGVFSTYVVRDPFIGFAISVLSFLVIETVRIGIEIDSMHHSVEILTEVTTTFQSPPRNDLDSYFNTLLLSRINKVVRDTDMHRIRIPASDGHSFWLRVFSYAQTSYLATTHSTYHEGWDRGFSDKNMLIHKSKLDGGVHIKRVFIVEDHDDFETMKNVIELQKGIGINVRYIDVTTIKKVEFLSNKIKRLGTYDYAVIDDTHVFKVFLDRNRRWTELELSNDVESLRLGKDIYDEIWAEATPA